MGLPAQTLVTPAAVPVPTPGTAVQLSSTVLQADQVVIQANPANAGNVAVGDSNVNASTPRGIVLIPGQFVSFEGSRRRDGSDALELDTIWIDAVNANDGVLWGYLKR